MRHRCSFIAGLALLALAVSACGAPTHLTSPRGVAVDGSGNVLITCGGERDSVVVMSRRGEVLREFGSGSLEDPAGIAVDGRGRIIVASPGRGEVVIFDAEGNRIAVAADLGKPEDLTVDEDAKVFVSDPEGGRIVVLRPGLEDPRLVVDAVVSEDGSLEPLNQPRGMAIRNGRLYVCDAGNHRILAMPVPADTGPPRVTEVFTDPEMNPRAIAFGAGGRIYVIDGNRIRGFEHGWMEFGSFRARAVRMWYEPVALAVDRDGSVLSLDASTRRVLVTSEELFDEEPRLTLRRGEGDLSDAVIEWTTLAARPTVLRYGPTEECSLDVGDSAPKRRHRVVLEDLEPSTLYHYHTSCPVDAIPPTTAPREDLALRTQRQSYALLSRGNFSGEYAFATLPARGCVDWIQAPTVVVVYRHVTFEPGPDGTAQPDRVLDDDDIALLKSEMETYRVWAWRHSSLKMNFDFAYVVVDEPRASAMLGSVTPQMFDDIVTGLASQGRDLHDFWYAVVCGTAGWYAHYLAGTVAGSEYELGSCYTAFGPDTKPGWWWFPTHEHGHLVHSWLMCSGAAFFAFPDAPWTLPGKFGENFSFMAYNCRQLPVRDWLILKRGILNQSVDTNGNGVPDDDPRTPLDERRFGWDKAMGGDCLKRIMAGGRTPGHPGDTDTDFDGNAHKLNEGELYWIDREIPRSRVLLDGRLDPGEWRELTSIPNLSTPLEQRGLKARLFVGWDEKNYYFAIQSDRPVTTGFDLDAANDGWFHGRDNLRFSVRPPAEGRSIEASGAIWDFLGDRINLHEGQHWYRGAYGEGDIQAAVGEQDGWFVVECAVPGRPDCGIAPGAGSTFGLRVHVSNEAGEDPVPQTGFFDGEDFVYDLSCTE